MEPFKNNISPELVRCIGSHAAQHHAGFDRLGFEADILAELEDLELKQRAGLIARHLDRYLPRDLSSRFAILQAMLHPMTEIAFDRGSDERGIRGWGMMPLGMVVAASGLDDFDASFALLKEMTKRATSEFDVRPFLAQDQERALAIMAPWVKDESVHVRRLVSEGTRPRLPWGMRLQALVVDPTPTLPLLEALKDDPEDYVRRSVANHLNDIAKDHPDLVADIAKSWLKDAEKPREKLVRHACRSLIKQGHTATLEAFGLNPPEVRVEGPQILTSEVAYGEAVGFEFELVSTSSNLQDLVLDYLIHFKKANGTLAPKVFKWTKLTLAPGERLTLSRSHAIRPITTRVYYGGTQAVSLRINGQDFGFSEFELVMEKQ
ncbi:putative DNA alkylation repair protein [Roseibium aggregatum IAM 12614]|uniref:Putative DNA alkylation repair protein n=1 Tax=Roseibium aggregatum (strain ATCC 25650 / DSM 13394 / JCM 20685 / NBRC 16684 / NCIMB 2208 / IAM 12614 / B1) TaxID=384765 RepID=A0NRX2_ROSAI|nr:DNA alkylation repair protein [Roseibium aggregatum]EAV44301.1 putative DNA alkylation repair protein [Roseibium aggregatum IAM 12614]